MSSIVREIPQLSVFILKEIAKKPSIYVTENALKKLRNHHDLLLQNYDSVQTAIIDAVTEAGRFTDEAIPQTFFSFNSFSRKSISLKNSKLSGPKICQIIECYPNLESIDVSGCFQVDDDTIKFIILNVKNLQHLVIRNCRKLTDKTFDLIIENNKSLTNLKEINVGGNFNMTRDGIASLFKCKHLMKTLESLNIAGLPVNDSIVSLISLNCKTLKSLFIGYADISEQEILRCLEAIGSKLEILSLSWICTVSGSINIQINSEALVAAVLNTCPKLTEIDLSGLKSFNLANAQTLLDFKYQKASLEPDLYSAINVMHLKFVGSAKTQMENVLVPFYQNVQFIL